MQHKPRLISFDLCPFVQRSVITLLEKGVAFERIDIDLAKPPAWFLDISPLGKVPVLQMGDSVLFESAIINEYLDEIHPPSMQPSDPLHRAINRAWAEVASELIGSQYHLMLASDETDFELHHHSIVQGFKRLEGIIVGPFFNGERFQLVDAAFAPLFTRFQLLEQAHPLGLFEAHPKLAAWSAALLARPSVIQSVKPTFAQDFYRYIREHGGGHGAHLFADKAREII